MKGLVFKDLLLMKKMNKKVIFVMYFFVIAISFFGENEVYSTYIIHGYAVKVAESHIVTVF